MYLNDAHYFVNASSTKTKAGAVGRLDNAFAVLDGAARKRIIHFVISRAPAQFVAVAILPPEYDHLVRHFAEHNVLVLGAE